MEPTTPNTIAPTPPNGRINAIGITMMIFSGFILLTAWSLTGRASLPTILFKNVHRSTSTMSMTGIFQLGAGAIVPLVVIAYNIACFIASVSFMNKKPWAWKFLMYNSILLLIRDAIAVISLIILMYVMIKEGGRGTEAVMPIGSLLIGIVVVNVIIYIVVFRMLRSANITVEFTDKNV